MFPPQKMSANYIGDGSIITNPVVNRGKHPQTDRENQ